MKQNNCIFKQLKHLNKKNKIMNYVAIYNRFYTFKLQVTLFNNIDLHLHVDYNFLSFK